MDGVSDYLDDDPFTSKGVPVDEFGRESIISYLKSKKYKILYDNKLNVILTKNNS